MHDAAWPFDDPRNLASFTVSEVLSGAKPILSVSHDVSDGSWQFLTGDPVDLADAKLVCLADVVGLDQTLLELADLPLGWSAERPAKGRSWKRKASFPTEWQQLVSTACEYTEIQQARMKSDFCLLLWERYDFDQEHATLVFSSGGVQRLTARIQIVGSVSNKSRTWLWSWANSSVLEQAAEGVHLLQKFGVQHGFERLAEASWTADEVDGWEMTAVACLLLGGEGVYRVPDENGALFVILGDPHLLEAV